MFDCSLLGIIALQINDNSIQSKLASKQGQSNLIFVCCSDLVAFRLQRIHANYCNPFNLGHQFTLILLISTRHIKLEIKILYRKPDIGKDSKNLSKTPILLLNLLLCINKKSVIVIGKNKQESEKFRFYCKPDLSNYW